MTETQISNQLFKIVQIEGDKNGFNSKSAIAKFKQEVKTNNNFDLVELSKKFIKSNYQLIQISNSNEEYKFNIKLNNSLIPESENKSAGSKLGPPG